MGHQQQVLKPLRPQPPNHRRTDQTGMPSNVNFMQIPDKADSSKYIDEYVDSLTLSERKAIRLARDKLMFLLEYFDSGSELQDIFDIDADFSRGPDEKFLFDHKIPTLTDDQSSLLIDGFVNDHLGKYYLSSRKNRVTTGRKIYFKIMRNNRSGLTKWKVRNDDSLEDEKKRGDITDNQTKNDPEGTEFTGNHYVECYLIEDNACFARSRCDVIIN